MAYSLHAQGGGGKRKISDFLIQWTQRRGRQTAQDQLTIFKALAGGGPRGDDS